MVPSAAAIFTNGEVPQQDDLVIALMGTTGCGKSTFIKLCTGRDIAIGHNLESCTEDVQTYSFTHPNYPAFRIFLVDTPGFDDTNRSDSEILRTLAAWLTASFLNGIKLSGIIYLHRINQPRMQGSARRNVKLFEDLCGDNALKNVILVTTMWDILGTDEGLAEEREKQLRSKREYWGYMVDKGSEIFRHNNSEQSALKVIEHIVKKNSRVVLNVQNEMVNGCQPLNKTTVGRGVQELLAEQNAKFSVELRTIQSDLAQALREQNEEMVEIMRELREEHTRNIQEVRKSQMKLNATIQQIQEEKYAKIERQLQEMSLQRVPLLSPRLDCVLRREVQMGHPYMNTGFCSSIHSLDGRRVVMAMYDGEGEVLRSPKLQEIRVLDIESGEMSTIDPTPHIRRRVLEIRRQYSGDLNELHFVDGFAPTGDGIILRSQFSGVNFPLETHIYSTGKPLPSPRTEAILSKTGSVDISDAVMSLDGQITAYTSGKLKKRGSSYLVGGMISSITSSPDSKIIVLVTTGNMLQFWKTKGMSLQGQCLIEPALSTHTLSLSPNGKLVAVSYKPRDSQFWRTDFWRITDNGPNRVSSIGRKSGSRATSLSFDGELFAESGYDFSMNTYSESKIWYVGTGRVVSTEVGIQSKTGIHFFKNDNRVAICDRSAYRIFTYTLVKD
ncbi:hypothetical protein M434DRAFT_39029 [Hypoxylon sp. CO27-5]|nr:hypothetical protein M434DRAFT_39029 [Hypoxylon sp. CO27-5]